MSTPNYSQKIGELRNRVSEYAKINQNTSGNDSINYKSYLKYTIIPVGMLILFIFIKPSFVMTKKTNETTKILSLKKLLIFTIIVSLLVGVCIYFLTRYKFLIMK